MLKKGDKVKILDAGAIGADEYFKSGEVVELIVLNRYPGRLALKTTKESVDGGVILLKEDYKYIKKV